MNDGIINLDAPRGNAFGFTSDKFDGYLWKRGNEIWVSFIVSRQEDCGNLSKLFDSILSQGFAIKVPTPFPHMQAILEAKDFHPTVEIKDTVGPVRVWVKEKDVMRL